MSGGTIVPAPRVRRCAIYTRKSTEEGLDQDFNTLDAQREAGEAFVNSQRAEGWQVSPVRYDDGGYTGANTDRPALQRLLADIERGLVDVVVVYKIDRLSRSLLDFAKLVEVFERRDVSLAAVTQQFNTSTSLGRLVLNILLSFAQFEREMIAERTRDKMRAARKKGKWIGGRVPFGYDVVDKKLVVNDAEAERVRALFDMYLEHHSITKLVEHANNLAWTTKAWRTKTRDAHPTGLWTKGSMARLLANPVYIGMRVDDGALIPGEHRGIVDNEKFSRVSVQLGAGRNGRDWVARNVHSFLLRGLVRCTACGTSMVSSTGRSRGKDYRYYTCLSVKQRGKSACAVRHVSAPALETFVVERIREIAKNPAVVADTIAAVAEQQVARLPELEAERRRLDDERAECRREARALVARLRELPPGATSAVTERLSELERRATQVDARIGEIAAEVSGIESAHVSQDDVAAALAGFDEVWDALKVNEQIRVIRLIIDRLDYDGAAGTISLSYSPGGIAILRDEVAVDTKGGNAA